MGSTQQDSSMPLLALLPYQPWDEVAALSCIALPTLALVGLVVCVLRRQLSRRQTIAGSALGACLLVTIIFFLLPRVAKVKQAGPRTVAMNSLRQITIAMHGYADANENRLPPAAIYNKDGQPLLSWRVLLLPYLGETHLYKQFHLDEAWDSPHNFPLVERMPTVYAPPSGLAVQAPPNTTFYQVFVGKGTAFEGRQGLLLNDFLDGLSNTILVAEAGTAVAWSKPTDLPYAADAPLPPLGGIFTHPKQGGRPFFAIMADGNVLLVGPEVSEQTLRAAITRNDGKPLGPDWKSAAD